MKNYAFITALNTESYLPGVRALHRNLIHVGSRFPLVVIIPDGATTLAQELRRDGITYLHAPEISIDSLEQMGNHYWGKTFFKIQAFGLTSFDKIVLIDCDILILKNLDALFSFPHISAASVGPAIGLRGDAWSGLTSGVLVVEPSEEEHRRVLGHIEPVIRQKLARGHRAGDQDVLNAVYRDVWETDRTRRLPETFNLIWSFLEEYCLYHLPCGLDDVSVVHFSGSRKPWHMSAGDIEHEKGKLSGEGKMAMHHTLEEYLKYFI